MEKCLIDGRISYLPASTNPLSADVGIIEGDEFLYLFDVGADEAVAEFLNHLPKEKKLILSHFHPDHMKNIGRIAYTECYIGANTAGYLWKYIGAAGKEEKIGEKEAYWAGMGQDAREAFLQSRRCRIVDRPVSISDGIALTVFPMPSSHAKGSLAAEVNGEYTFLGDAAYGTVKAGRAVYNAQLLKEQIELLKTLSSEYLLLSHAEPFVQERQAVLEGLEKTYRSRVKGEPYIAAEE